MNDARLRILAPLLAASLAAAGCATTPLPAPAAPPVEQVVDEPDEVAFPDEADAPEAPPKELKAGRPGVEPLGPLAASANAFMPIRGEPPWPQANNPRAVPMSA